MVSQAEVREKLSELIKDIDKKVKYQNERLKEEAETINKKRESHITEVIKVLKMQNVDLEAIMRVDSKSEHTIEEIVKIKERIKMPSQMEHVASPQVEKIKKTFEDSNLYVQLLFPYYTRQYEFNGTVDAEGYDIGDLKPWWWRSGGGGGWGCWAFAYPDPVITVERWFYFTPPTSGVYSMFIFQPYDGFYIVRADDGFWTCKESWVKVDGFTSVYQYYWGSDSWFTVLSIEGDNIDRADRLDTVYVSPYVASLGGGDIAYILLTQRLRLFTRGDGSYAELNFNEGVANVLHPPYVMVQGL
jgi:hypothetical protein